MDSVASPLPRQGFLRVPRGSHLLAFAVLIGALVLVLLTWHYARQREMRSAQLEFIAKTNEITDLLRQRLGNYELVTRGGAALFASVARPTPQQWEGYVEGMDLRRRFPAIVGLGFAGYVSGARLDDLQVEWKEAGYGMLEVHPYGVRDFYGPVLYLEPKTPENLSVVGFDMYSDPVRRVAMQASLESGTAQLTGPLQLVQDAAFKHISVLLYLPVYRDGARPDHVAERMETIQGWIYIPFRMQRFVETALGKSRADAKFRILDIEGGAQHVLYETPGLSAGNPAFRHSRSVRTYGRLWRIEFESPPVEQAVPALAALQNMLALGLFAALLLYGVAWSLARTESSARAMAWRLTEDFRRSEKRFRSAMQYSAIGKALLDSDGKIVEANPALGAIVGLPPSTLVGVRLESLFEDDVTLAEKLGNVRDSEGVQRTTRRVHREGGSPRHAQLTFAPVPGNVGQDIVGLVQVEDVTDRMRSEARVHALNRTLEARVALRTRELSQVNQELETFAYSVSHDLRAPLRALDGFSRILMERYADRLDESGRDYLTRVRKAAGRMGELIDAMLKMSRLSRSAVKPERIDFSRMAMEVVEELHMSEGWRDVDVHIQSGLEVTGDATLLRNLLSNLLGNAWKFTREVEHARIDFAKEGEEYVVRDNGAGFPQEYVDKLFRPFQRLHSQDSFAGHGIGLATVKRIVERHGGTIRAEGREGEGAAFYFTLADDMPE